MTSRFARRAVLALAAGLLGCPGPTPQEDTPKPIPPGAHALEISGAPLPMGRVGESYDASLGVSGGVGSAYEWRVESGALPPGLTLGAEGTRASITGTPDIAGTFELEVLVSDDANGEGSVALSIVVEAVSEPDPLQIVTQWVPVGQRGSPYAAGLEARGGSERGYRWAVTAGALPAGLTVEEEGTPSTQIVGTPDEGGMFTFTITVTDDEGSTVERAFTMTVRLRDVTIDETPIPDLVVGTATTVYLFARGGSGDGFTWRATSGALPPGLRLEPRDDRLAITGTPAMRGRFPIELEVTDVTTQQFAARSIEIVVHPALELFVRDFPPLAMGNVEYEAVFEASGGAPGGLHWGVSSGRLHDGLELSRSGTECRIIGVPTVAGTRTFTIRVTDALLSFAEVELTLEVRVPLTIDQTELPPAARGVPYSTTVTASGGTGGYQWSLVSGALLPGLSFGVDAGGSARITGTTTVSDTATFELEVMDSSGEVATSTLSIATVEPIDITTTVVPGRGRCEPGVTILETTGGSPSHPLVWSISGGALPPGWVLSDGRIFGRSDTPGTYTFTVSALDASGATDSESYSVTITQGGPASRAIYIGNGTLTQHDLYRVDLCRSTPRTAALLTPSSPMAGVTGTPAISPDGTKLAFAADFTNNDIFDLYVIDLTRPSPSPVAVTNLAAPHADVHHYNIEWSPDSTLVAFQSDLILDEHYRVYVADVTNPALPGGPLLVGATYPAATVQAPDMIWSKDSEKLVYGTRDLNGVNPSEVWYVDLTDLANVPPAHALGFGTVAKNSWAPDGRAFIQRLGGTGGLRVVNVDTAPPTTSLLNPATAPLTTRNWAWSPGTPTQILFDARASAASPNVPYVASYLAGSFGPAVPALPPLSAGQEAWALRWSTTGAQLAVCGILDATGIENIFVLDVASGLPATPVRISDAAQQQYCRRPFEPGRMVVWSPDDSRVAYFSEEQAFGGERAFIVAAPGAPAFPKTAVTPPNGDATQMLWTEDGDWLVAVARDASASAVAYVGSAGPVTVQTTWPTPPPALSITHTSMLPDGEGFVMRASSSTTELFMVDFAGSTVLPPVVMTPPNLPSTGIVGLIVP